MGDLLVLLLQSSYKLLTEVLSNNLSSLLYVEYLFYFVLQLTNPLHDVSSYEDWKRAPNSPGLYSRIELERVVG